MTTAAAPTAGAGVITGAALEEALIGFVCAGGDAHKRSVFPEVLRRIPSDELFAMAPTLAVFQAARALMARGVLPSSLSLARELERTDAPPRGTRWAEYLAACVERTSITRRDELDALVDQLLQIAKRRSVARYAQRLSDIVAGGSDAGVDSELDAAHIELHRTRQRLTTSGEDESAGKGAGRVLAMIQQVVDGAPSPWSIRTGLYTLDKKIGRKLRAGNLVIVGAHPGVGKSAFALGIAVANGIYGEHRAAYLSLEMSTPELVERAFAHVGLVDLDHIQEPEKLTVRELARLRDAHGTLGGGPGLTFRALPGATIPQLETELRILALEGVRVVIIDYIQLIVAQREGNREQEVNRIGAFLKTIAGQLGIVVVALSQMNAEMFERTTLRPESRDLRESKSLEAHADCILLLWRPEQFGLGVFPEKKRKTGGEWEGPSCTGKARIIVGKLRNGIPNQQAECRWYGQYQLFADYIDAIEIDREHNQERR